MAEQKKNKTESVYVAFVLAILVGAVYSGMYVSANLSGGGDKGFFTGICVFIAGVVSLIVFSVFFSNTLLKNKLIVSLVGLVIFAWPTLYVINRLVIPYYTLKSFLIHIEEYTSFHDLKKTEGPYIRGKIIPIDKKTNQIDGILFELPDELRPMHSQDVKTVVWLEWELSKIGNYGGRGSASIWHCWITVIDKTKPVMLEERKLFTGEGPPVSSAHGNSQSGTKPIDKIVDYLKALPRK